MYQLDLGKPWDLSMFGRVRQKKNWEHGERKLNVHLLVIAIDGQAEFGYLDTVFSVQKGDCLLIPARTSYTAGTSSFCEYYFFHFNSALKEMPAEAEKPVKRQEAGHPFQLSPADPACIFLSLKTTLSSYYSHAAARLEQCQECSTDRDPLNRLLLNSLFTELLILLSRCRLEHNNQYEPPAMLHRITSYIRRNYTSPLSLRTLAREFGVSESYVARLFRQYLSTTVSQYVNRLKLDYSAELLKNSNMNVNEISDYLGFSDCYYFSKLFKKQFLDSPIIYRKKNCPMQ